MGKSFVLYTQVDSEEKFVNCIYFINEVCRAQPQTEDKKISQFYKPTEEECKNFCNNSEEFKACPRFTAYQMHLKAIGLEK